MGYLARAAVLLVGALVLFFVAKWLLGPGNLELFEPDRSQNVVEWASKPLQYADVDEECASCHAERVRSWRDAAHQGLSCESCHGAAQGHLDSGVSLAIEEPRELCALCHARLLSRPASQPQVDIEEHAGPLVCTACHNPHAPSLAGPPRVPHSLEERSECTVCHGPGGFKPFPADHAGRTSDICLACHQQAATPTPPTEEAVEPAGPPRVPHSLEGRSDCTICHGPGGFKPFPEDHAGRTSDICLACHQQQ